MPERNELRPAKRLCLFGGTFDPIHIAHLRIANEALEAFSLTQVLFVPAGRPPHKDQSSVSPFEDRFRMVEIACAPYPPFVASRLEASGEPSYTVDTVDRARRYLRPEDELFFLIGADAFDEIATWSRWEELVKLLQFIVVSRPGRDYQIPPGATVHPLMGLDLPVSSSAIRESLGAGNGVAGVPTEVSEYILERGLYGAK